MPESENNCFASLCSLIEANHQIPFSLCISLAQSCKLGSSLFKCLFRIFHPSIICSTFGELNNARAIFDSMLVSIVFYCLSGFDSNACQIEFLKSIGDIGLETIRGLLNRI